MQPPTIPASTVLRIATLIAIALATFVAATPAQATCPSFPVPLGPINSFWMGHGGCASKLGDPIAASRRNAFTGGLEQDFAHGQIVVFDRWASGGVGQMPRLVMAAWASIGAVHVEWSDTKPFSYDFFNVRWDFDGLEEDLKKQHEDGAQQEQVAGGVSGALDFAVKDAGVLRISIEGCDKGFLSSSCKQGFSHPVTIDVPPELKLNVPAPLTSASVPPQPPTTVRLFDNIADGIAIDMISADSVAATDCDAGALLDADGGHKGELATTATIAVLLKVRNILTIPCRNLPDAAMQTDATKLRAFVNGKIRDAKVISQAGTDAGVVQGLVGAVIGVAIAVIIASFLGLFNGPLIKLIAAIIGIAAGAVLGFLECDTSGDYDMRLVGIIQIRFTFDDLLDQSTKDHILNELLVVHGPASKRREHLWLCGIPTFVPETENHILMTESSRYLTNKLRAEDAVRRAVPISPDDDNDANGMTDWFLGHLQSFMQFDFYEYNSRPYTFQARNGIQNLHDFAAWPAGFCWRSNPGDPTMPAVPRSCDVRRGARIVLDYLAAKFAVSNNGLRRVAPFRRQPPRREYPFLFGRGSDEAMWTYLALQNGSHNFWTRRYGLPHGGAAENIQHAYTGEFRVSPVISDIMSDSLAAQEYFERFYYQRGSHYAIELYYREPLFLISAGGVHDDGRLSLFGNTEDAWAMATTLMPNDEVLDRRELVRIGGNADEGKRVNTCVAPGFACGENPVVPAGIPDACKIVNGDWTFLDLAGSSPNCDINYGFFVVVYSTSCEKKTCDDRFGFFEALLWGNGLPALATTVLANNAGSFPYHEDQVGIYKGASGLLYKFVPVPPWGKTGPFTTALRWENWGIVSVTTPGGATTVFDRKVLLWPLADGGLVHSDKHTGCVIVDNPRLNQRLVLDYSDKNHPRRTRIWLDTEGKECGCPLPLRCLPLRFQ